MDRTIRGKYAIAGVGNTPYGRVPGVSALSHNVNAIAAAPRGPRLRGVPVTEG